MFLTDEMIRRWNERCGDEPNPYWCKLCKRAYGKGHWVRRRWLCPTQDCPAISGPKYSGRWYAASIPIYQSFPETAPIGI